MSRQSENNEFENSGEMMLAPVHRNMPAPRYPGFQMPPRETNAESDDFQALLQLLQVVWTRKWVLAATVAVGSLIALGLSLYTTPRYGAQTTMQIETVQEPFGAGMFSEDPTLITESQLLSSQTMRERAAKELRSRGAPPPPRVVGLLTALRSALGLQEPATAAGWDEAVGMAAGKLRVITQRDSHIVQIQTESVNPQAAADYTNTLAEEYIKRNQEQRWEAYQSTGDWLNQAQNETKAKLERSEKALADYAKSRGLLFTSETNNVSEEKLKAVQSQLAQASADRILRQAIYESSLSSPTESLPEVLDSGPMGSYQVKLAELKQQLAELSTTLTPEHYRVQRVQAQINELEAARERERTNIIKRIRIEYEAAQKRENQLLKNFDDQSKVITDDQEKLIQYNILKREVESNKALYQTTLLRGKEASIASAMRTNNAHIVDRARISRLPGAPNVPLNLALGSLGGLFCGAVFIIVRSRTDVRVHAPDALGAMLSIQQLGVIPSAKVDPEVRALARRSRSKIDKGGVAKMLFKSETTNPSESLELVTWTRNRSILAEAFRATMTSILFAHENGSPCQVLLITSPSPQEGKSTVLSNLGVALAEIGQRVLLIDGDTRLPRLHTIFDVPNTYGLGDILSERTPVGDYSDEMLTRTTAIPGLHVIPAGPARSQQLRLLYSTRMKELIQRARGSFDIILIDSPPVLSVPDARILSLAADAVILVVRAHKTPSGAATLAASRFQEDGRPIFGTILNDWNAKASGDPSYGEYYSNYYSEYYRTAGKS